MKAKLFFSVLVAAFLSLPVVSAQDKNVNSSKSEELKDIRSQIVKSLNKIEFGDEASVNIYLLVDESNVKIFKVEGTNSQLVSEVKERIKDVKFDAPKNYVGKYTLKVNFVDAYSKAAGLVAGK